MATPPDSDSVNSDSVNLSSTQAEESHSQRRKRIAVIAVHGVSDQAPNSTARAIADLLLRDGNTTTQTYDNFRETGVRIPVTPTQVSTPSPFECEHQPIQPRTNKILDLNERGEWLTYLLDASNRAKEQAQTGQTQTDHPKTPGEQATYLNNPTDKSQLLPNDSAHLFTVDQLRQCNTHEIYESIRIEGVRAASPLKSSPTVNPSEPELEIHIYEMFWADLSRLGSGILQIFGSLYQLLFHLVSLGRQTVDMARIENQTYPVPSFQLWRYYGISQKWAGRMLSLFIPLLNLYMLVAAFLFLPMQLGAEQRSLLGFLLSGLLLTVFGGVQVWKRINPLKQSLGLWVTLTPVVFAVALVLGLYYCRQIGPLWAWFGNAQWMTVLWAIFLFTLLWVLLIRPYNHHRPGTSELSLGIGAIFLLSLGVLLFSQGNLPTTEVGAAIAQGGGISFGGLAASTPEMVAIASVSLRLVELIYVALFGCWLLFLLFYGCAYSLATVLIYVLTAHHRQHQGNPAQQDQIKARLERFKRTAWTARFSLSLPAILFSILTLSLWTALQRIGARLLPMETYQSLLFRRGENMGALSFQEFTQQLTVFSGSQFAVWVMICLLIALFLMFWGIAPSALAEIQPPQPPNRRSPNVQTTASPFGRIAAQFGAEAAEQLGIDLDVRVDPVEQSYKFGYWLTHGFGLYLRLGEWRFFWILGEWIVSFVIPLLMVGGTGLGLYKLIWGHEDFKISGTASLLDLIAGLLTASATSLIAFRNQLAKISLGLRGVLDVLLDVDNYLRLHPLDSNPKGKIYARYTSLLRYLCQWKNPDDGHGYDGLVIVAHSQGTVISADVLRFLKLEPKPDPTLVKLGQELPIELLTMGCPLKQLYSFAFPNRYHWVIDQLPPRIQWRSAVGLPAPAFPQEQHWSHQSPNPATLGVRCWVNAYRSGDYVGRVLWRDPNDPLAWRPTPHSVFIQDAAGKNYGDRREYCIGSGAHTHYWDATAPMVAQEIDRMIVSFSPKPQPRKQI
jgi:hypothetical protein